MARLLLVPHLGTAEDEVLVLEWLVKSDEDYHKGQTLLVLETLKASFEVEAEEEGVLLERLAAQGDRLPLQAPLAILGRCGESLDPRERETLLAEAGGGSAGMTDGGADEEIPVGPGARSPAGSGAKSGSSTEAHPVPAAPAARLKARELGVDLAFVQGSGRGGMIRVQDVEEAALKSSTVEVGPGRGRVAPEFLERLRGEENSFAALPSEEKLETYRRHGAQIGADCVLGKGSLFVCEQLILGAGVTIGADCRIEARDFVAGAGTHLGDRCRVRCRRVLLGENAFFVTDIEIGGGGAMDPEALLEVGSHGFVGEHVHLNPCRPLRIGDEVVISRGASLMTHSFGLDVLQGYPNRFAGITIEDECQIGIGAVLFPGVRVGRGSILLSNSSLVTDLPEGRLFGGVPAKDIKAAARTLSATDKRALVEDLIREFGRQLSLRDLVCEIEGGAGELVLEVLDGGLRHVLRFSEQMSSQAAELVVEDLRVALRCEDEVWAALPSELSAMDLGQKRYQGKLGPLGEAFREWLRKHGVRLSPRNWTYGGGWL